MDWSVEFERRQKVDRVTATPLVVHLHAEPEERRAIAKRLELQDVAKLEADCELDRPVHGDSVRLKGKLTAQVTQTCVVTLEPIPVELTAEFERLYVPGWKPEMEGDEEAVDAEAPDMEPLEGDSIDLGEAVVEELSLALDPYPRLPGVEVDEDGEADRPNPFQALSALRRS
ncbi:MAG TPA: DUF177 domain-containing protein [Geminicoccus sp.]|uniref:YceD family protein n=1 Tax=Geminicoccus sp. TaxID=2024832 RepID=UPI002E31FB4B|nr:DUF177 domain-containing protein [Geminicoccus sp.]HEX2525538.1 DUF177 domain-containing protein [Geminicoccus sp.]